MSGYCANQIKRINMKKLIITLSITSILIISAAIFYSCEKEKAENNNFIAKSTIENPYDVFGQLHNKAMEEILPHILKGEFINLDVFSINFVEDNFTIFPTEVPYPDFIAQVREINNKMLWNEILSIDLEEMYNLSYFNCLSFYQQQKLQQLFNTIEESDSSNLQLNITTFENYILNDNTVVDTDKEIVLFTISIAKYSYLFFIEHQDVLLSGTKAPSFQDCLRYAKELVLSDAAGASLAFIWGIAKGLFSGALVFGPQGIIAVATGAALAGAIQGSAAYVIETLIL
jgi:hypothetical protein